MAQGLSVLARLIRQGRFAEFETGSDSPRTDSRLPARRGFTRGSLGSSGVRSPGNPGTRNPDAQEDQERETIMSVLRGRVS